MGGKGAEVEVVEDEEDDEDEDGCLRANGERDKDSLLVGGMGIIYEYVIIIIIIIKEIYWIE